jgi:hypothetical protein
MKKVYHKYPLNESHVITCVAGVWPPIPLCVCKPIVKDVERRYFEVIHRSFVRINEANNLLKSIT